MVIILQVLMKNMFITLAFLKGIPDVMITDDDIEKEKWHYKYDYEYDDEDNDNGNVGNDNINFISS